MSMENERERVLTLAQLRPTPAENLVLVLSGLFVGLPSLFLDGVSDGVPLFSIVYGAGMCTASLFVSRHVCQVSVYIYDITKRALQKRPTSPHDTEKTQRDLRTWTHAYPVASARASVSVSVSVSVFVSVSVTVPVPVPVPVCLCLTHFHVCQSQRSAWLNVRGGEFELERLQRILLDLLPKPGVHVCVGGSGWVGVSWSMCQTD